MMLFCFYFGNLGMIPAVERHTKTTKLLQQLLSVTVEFWLIQTGDHMLTSRFDIRTEGLSPRLPLQQEYQKMDIVSWVPRLFWEPEPLRCP